ncbi:MAG: GNAT family N-acetyltransferase [Bacteroidota bacterium]|nr:GNAT family N-acetyltransferase [Bacteroidota bacterium]
MNIRLRALEKKDIDTLYNWENDQELWNVSCTTAPFSRYVLEQYIENSHLDIYSQGQLRFMIETTAKEPVTVGMVDLYSFEPFHMRAGVGIMIHRKYRQKGYAAKALDLLFDYTFRFLNLKQLFCEVADDNLISLNLFTNKGFEITGIRKAWLRRGNRWVDAHFLQLINKNYQ